MKDARYLVRVRHSGDRQPSEQAVLLAQVRSLMDPIRGKAINLRVGPVAIEFDLFVDPSADVQKFLSALAPLGEVLTCKRLDVPPPAALPEPVVAEARHLFNEHRFWEVHEVLEGLWKELRGQEKELVQGLILTAAALVHVQKDEWLPVWTMLADAMRRLAGQPDTYHGWDVAKFRDHFQKVIAQKKIDFPTV